MVRPVAVPLFFRSPQPGEIGEPMEFIRVKNGDTSPEEWDRVLRRRPFVANFGAIEVAVRGDKFSDPAVQVEMWRIGLARPFGGSSAFVAKFRRSAAEGFLRCNPELALLFARAAQSAKPSREGAKLLKRAETAFEHVTK